MDTPALLESALLLEPTSSRSRSLVIRRTFHRWERRLAAVSNDDRTVRAFEWGLDWLDYG